MLELSPIRQANMNDTAMLALAIIGAVITWTTSIVLLVLWLTNKFRSLEKALYREMDKHRREDDVQFNGHSRKLQRLEIKVFGFTAPNGVSLDPEEGPTFPGP